MELETIKARIELYKKQQKELIDEANRKISELAGAIAALEQLVYEAEDGSSTAAVSSDGKDSE